LADRARVVAQDALTWLRGPGRAEPLFDVAFLDPPYGEPALLEAGLDAVGLVVRPGGRIVAKHHWRSGPSASIGLVASERERRFGETALTFYRRSEEP
jgi:16S rRNA G966 N2-methylase RsmD